MERWRDREMEKWRDGEIDIGTGRNNDLEETYPLI